MRPPFLSRSILRFMPCLPLKFSIRLNLFQSTIIYGFRLVSVENPWSILGRISHARSIPPPSLYLVLICLWHQFGVYRDCVDVAPCGVSLELEKVLVHPVMP